MLNRQDDFPIHQTPDPVAAPVTGDRNVYDRYFFNGYSRDGALYFAAAMGLYANRNVLDASFSVVRGGGDSEDVPHPAPTAATSAIPIAATRRHPATRRVRRGTPASVRSVTRSLIRGIPGSEVARGSPRRPRTESGTAPASPPCRRSRFSPADTAAATPP